MDALQLEWPAIRILLITLDPCRECDLIEHVLPVRIFILLLHRIHDSFIASLKISISK